MKMCGYRLTVCDHCKHQYEYEPNPYFSYYCDAFPTDKGIPYEWFDQLAQYKHPEKVECANGFHFEKRKRK